MIHEITKPVGRRDLPEFEHNPSVSKTLQKMKVGVRRIPNRTGDKCMIVSDSGEIIAPAGFHEVVEVDRTQFVKLYIGGIKAFNGLSGAGVKIYELVYTYLANNSNTDSIVLHHKESKLIPKVTFERGLTELLNREILFKSLVPNKYFINIDYCFNGNRLAFIKEYRLKEYNEPAELPA